MVNIIDQTDDSELTSGKVDSTAWVRNYTDLMRAAPLPEEEPSTDQLVALHHRVWIAHATPYVDFGIWGPFQRKTLRASKFRSWSVGPQGTYICKELPGPENYDQWLSSWRVFATACLMLNSAAEDLFISCFDCL
eukprot:6464798-Amphidinium_carterae.1